MSIMDCFAKYLSISLVANLVFSKAFVILLIIFITPFLFELNILYRTMHSMSILFSKKVKKILKNLENAQKSRCISILIKNKNGLKTIVVS